MVCKSEWFRAARPMELAGWIREAKAYAQMGIHHTRTGQWQAPKRPAVRPVGRCPSNNPGTAPAPHEALAAVAHELRLPLSHIKGFVTSLRRTDVNWDEETRKDFLAEIELETDRLAQLVDSLLASGPDGVLSPRAQLALTHPAAVVQGALHRIRPSLGERPLRLDVSSHLPSIRMDAGQMERVLANLIQNAIKYTPAGSAIGVSARLSATSNELELAVEDEGPGVPLEDRERIFEPFFREPAAAAGRAPGYGLGLAICKSIVLAHGGRIQVGDAPGGGAHFSVFLPAGVGRRPAWRRPLEANRSEPTRVAA
jgi:two-component system sensor histidine kinase KdpD